MDTGVQKDFPGKEMVKPGPEKGGLHLDKRMEEGKTSQGQKKTLLASTHCQFRGEAIICGDNDFDSVCSYQSQGP